MTIKSSFKLALNKIHVSPSIANQPDQYNCLGELVFRLVVQEETKYINFIHLSQDAAPSLLEPVKDFVRLITRTEFVSLTFNTLYIDSRNRKIIFRPSMLPCFSYEFDLIDGNLLELKRELADTCLALGFLTLKKLKLDAIDYLLDNGRYQAELEKDDQAMYQLEKQIDQEQPVSAGGF